jgi:hypothetical protein
MVEATMKLDQLAFYAVDQAARDDIKRVFGLQDARWIRDAAVGRAIVKGKKYAAVTAVLEFNYDLGIEFEILTFSTYSPYWQSKGHHPSFFSHIGIHVDEFPEIEAPLVYELWTEDHTNPYLKEQKRTYHYRIHDTTKHLGVYTKFIRRVEALPGVT